MKVVLARTYGSRTAVKSGISKPLRSANALPSLCVRWTDPLPVLVVKHPFLFVPKAELNATWERWRSLFALDGSHSLFFCYTNSNRNSFR